MKIIYSNFSLRVLYFIFILTNSIKNIFYFLFVFPFVKLIDFNKLLKSVSLFFKFRKIIDNEFEISLKNTNMERFIKDYEVSDMMKEFIAKNNCQKIGNVYSKFPISFNTPTKNEFLLKMTIDKLEVSIEYTEGRYYFIFKLNNNEVINVTKKFSRHRGISRMFLEEL